MNEDGTCLCKLCGEKVASRTHWYRHKYKVHNVALFRCEKCEIFFKSKKGYEGHLANKHAPKILGTDGFELKNGKYFTSTQIILNKNERVTKQHTTQVFL